MTKTDKTARKAHTLFDTKQRSSFVDLSWFFRTCPGNSKTGA